MFPSQVLVGWLLLAGHFDFPVLPDSHRSTTWFVQGIPVADECRNLLFETHWYTDVGGGSGSSQLAELPELKTNLRQCPAYNGIGSCCNEAFEREQNVHFRYWKAMFSSKLLRLGEGKSATQAVGKLEVFNAATDEEREEYDNALIAYDKVLDPANHASCFSGLLTFAAGMLCFGCDPMWDQHVQTDEGKIARVMLTESSCIELWQDCRDFSGVARDLKQAVLDSRLATMQTAPMENLEMFFDQEGLCDWAHDAIAMHPFTTPSEVEREAAPLPKTIVRRLASGTPVAAPAQRWSYDVMKAGRASGFDITWNGISAGTKSGAVGRITPLSWSLLLFTWLWVYFHVGCSASPLY